MTLEGIVRNGVIVPSNGPNLPEGTKVKILVESEIETPANRQRTVNAICRVHDRFAKRHGPKP